MLDQPMFADAYDVARGYTRPVVLSHRDLEGKCGSAIGACVVLNADGWCLTAAHILQEREAMIGAKKAFDRIGADLTAIEDDGRLNGKSKRKKKAQLIAGRHLLTATSD